MLRDVSLPPACADFRFRLDTAGGSQQDRHAEQCDACAAWALHRRTVAAARRERRPVPAALAERLRSIPERHATSTGTSTTPCPDAERLVRWARRRAHAEARDTTGSSRIGAEHLDGCAHCRRLVRTLESALHRRTNRLPSRLERRLRRVAQGGSDPRRSLVWAFDLRFASAAAALIGVLLMPISGPTAALARQAGSALREPIETLRTVPSGSIETFSLPMAKQADRAFGRLRTMARRYADSWVELADRTEAVWHHLQQAVAAATDDNPSSGDRDDDD